MQEIQASDGAFAAILADGSVVTWGDPGSGGDSRAVRDQLKNVQQIQASERAFAILGGGSLVTSQRVHVSLWYILRPPKYRISIYHNDTLG